MADCLISGKGTDEACDVVSPPHRERRELETRNPPFGPRLQRCHLLFRQIQACHVVEERDSLVDGETQVRGS
jgi:hypothetical protein